MSDVARWRARVARGDAVCVGCLYRVEEEEGRVGLVGGDFEWARCGISNLLRGCARGFARSLSLFLRRLPARLAFPSSLPCCTLPLPTSSLAARHPTPLRFSTLRDRIPRPLPFMTTT